MIWFAVGGIVAVAALAIITLRGWCRWTDENIY